MLAVNTKTTAFDKPTFAQPGGLTSPQSDRNKSTTNRSNGIWAYNSITSICCGFVVQLVSTVDWTVADIASRAVRLVAELLV